MCSQRINYCRYFLRQNNDWLLIFSFGFCKISWNVRSFKMHLSVDIVFVITSVTDWIRSICNWGFFPENKRNRTRTMIGAPLPRWSCTVCLIVNKLFCINGVERAVVFYVCCSLKCAIIVVTYTVLFLLQHNGNNL